MNCVTNIAAKKNRDYITPEDVSEALKEFDVDRVRLDVLEVLGQHSGFGTEEICEDRGLCAFVAWEGKTEEDK